MSRKIMERIHCGTKTLTHHRHFDQVTGFLSLSNPAVLVLQLYQVIIASNVEGVSIPMFLVFIVMQTAFGLVAIKVKNFGMMVSMALSILITISIIAIALCKG